MAQGEQRDIVLFGFRNELAKARARAFLEDLPRNGGGPDLAALERRPPQRLFTALEATPAQQLCAALDGLGAQVALVPTGTIRLPSAPRLERKSSGPGWVFLAAVLAIAVYWWRAQPRSLPQVPAVALSAAPLQALPTEAALDTSEAVALNGEGIAAAEAGHFAVAVEMLRQALRLAPDHPVLTRNLQTVLYNWGVHELAAKEFAEAARRLEEAAEIGPRAEVLAALGMAYLRQGDVTRADDTLQHALQLAPDDQNTLLALAQAALDQEQRPRALEYLQRAKSAGARGLQLDSLERQLSREVDAEWDFVHLDSPHFRASFADGDAAVVRQVLAGLEDAYDGVGRKFDYTPTQTTEVVLYAQQDFHSVTQSPHWAGAAFDGRIKLPVRGLDPADPRLQGILRHEYAHSLIARLAGTACPGWLNEGLAVWAEETADADKLPWAEQQVRSQSPLPLERLSGSFVSLPANQVALAYAESYLAVHTLLDRYGQRTLPDLLQALGSTHNLAEAFNSTYGADLRTFERDLLGQWAGDHE